MEVEGEQNQINPERVNGHDIPDRNGRKLQWLVVIICVISWLLGFSAGMLLIEFRLLHGKLLRWRVLIIGFTIHGLPILNRHRRSMTVTVAYSSLTFLFDSLATKIPPPYLSRIGLAFNASFICGQIFVIILLAMRTTYCPLISITLLLRRAARSGLWSTGERPGGVNRGHFILGFVFTIVGIVCPLAWSAFQEVVEEESPVVIVIALPFVLMVTATVCMVGLIINGDFGHLHQEDHHFRHDSWGYWNTFVFSPLAWQTFFLAYLGVVSLQNSLFYEM